jgi:nucleotide-binding universal stress UspA family protein
MSVPMPSSAPLLFAYDGSDLSRCAITRAGALMRGRRVIVLHVHEPIAVVPSPVGAALAVEATDLAYEQDLAAQQAGDRGETVAEQGAKVAEAAGFEATFDTALARGTAGIADAIVEKAASIDAAAIVLGSHGRSAIGAALLGSVSTAVLHRSTVPVFVVPHRAEH